MSNINVQLDADLNTDAVEEICHAINMLKHVQQVNLCGTQSDSVAGKRFAENVISGFSGDFSDSEDDPNRWVRGFAATYRQLIKDAKLIESVSSGALSKQLGIANINVPASKPSMISPEKLALLCEKAEYSPEQILNLLRLWVYSVQGQGAQGAVFRLLLSELEKIANPETFLEVVKQIGSIREEKKSRNR